MGARPILLALLLASLAACKPGAHEQRTGAIPPADAPANPGEPASAPVAADPAAVLEGPLDLNGAEPFWALKIRRDSLVLSRPEHADVIAVNPGPRIDGGRAVWEGVAVASGKPLKVTVEAGDCSNGMSDVKFPYRATVVSAGETLKGCGHAA
ncbi:MAG: COG3650 family protein [Caulobacteraceae bacterium]